MRKKKEELNIHIQGENKLALQLASYLLDKEIGTYSDDEELAITRCFVKLTPEIVEHLIELTEKGRDDFWSKDISFPGDGWVDDGYDEFRSHIGETVYLATSDWPWKNLLEADEIPEHTTMEYPKEMFFLALDCIDDQFLSESNGNWWLFKDLKNAITLLKVNGYSDNDIFALFKQKVKTMRL